MANDVQVPATLKENLETLLESLGDPRVASVLAGTMRAELEEYVSNGLPEAFLKAASDVEEFDGLPESVTVAQNRTEALISWVQQEAGQFVQPLAMAMAGLTGSFVSVNRKSVIEAMKQAGDGPEEDRQDRIVSASALVNTATSLVEKIPAAGDVSKAGEIMEQALERLEEAREILLQRALDDSIMYGSVPGSEVDLPEDVPGLTPRGRRTDVENLLFDSWMREVDGHVAIANLAGPEVDGTRVAGEEQHDYILDALVAIQDAFTVRPEADVLLKFGQLRLAKGDVGEARAAAEKVMEMVPDEDDPICQAAISLYHDVENSSPLSRRDKRCFIATAAMDDVDAPEVEALRAFRDDVLLKTGAGRRLVQVYYRLSPGAASLISTHASVRSLVRRFVVVPLARAVSGREISVSPVSRGREK